MTRSVVAAVLVLSSFAPGVAGSVLVVDALGGAPYTSIQAAVDAAANGDVVLVKAGIYGPVTIANKGVSVVADAGANVEIQGGVRIVETLAPHRVLLRGLVGKGKVQDPASVPEGLRLTLARGPVRVEACAFFGADGFSPFVDTVGSPGVRTDVALDLSMVGCDATGGDGAFTSGGWEWSAGGPGMVAAASSLALHDCTLAGGKPADADSEGEGGPGGAGLVAVDKGTLATLPTRVFAAGTTFVGHDGGVDFSCFAAGDGGDGAHLDGALVSAWFLDCSFVPGKKGACGGIGEDGVDVALEHGATRSMLPGAARGVVAASPVREGQALTLQVDAAAADACFLLAAVEGDWQLVLPLSGVLLTGPTFAAPLVPLGTAPTGGTFGVGVPVPLLPPGVDHLTVHLQGVFADPGGAWWLGGPATPLVLDAAF